MALIIFISIHADKSRYLYPPDIRRMDHGYRDCTWKFETRGCV